MSGKKQLASARGCASCLSLELPHKFGATKLRSRDHAAGRSARCGRQSRGEERRGGSCGRGGKGRGGDLLLPLFATQSVNRINHILLKREFKNNFVCAQKKSLRPDTISNLNSYCFPISTADVSSPNVIDPGIQWT